MFLFLWTITGVLYLLYIRRHVQYLRGNLIDIAILAPVLLLLGVIAESVSKFTLRRVAL
jgi:hypothetical protein